MQGGQAIRGPSTVTAGGTMQVEVGSGSSSLEVNFGPGGETHTIPVPADGTVTIPIPPAAGPFVTISVGKGLDRKSIIIEVISSPP